MPPVQLFFLISTPIVFGTAWLRGGHPERAVVAGMIVAYVSSLFTQDWRLGPLMIGFTLVDVGLFGLLIALALKADRWWLLLAAAAQLLLVLSHVALLAGAHATHREFVAASWVFGLVGLYALLLGVVERSLAGEKGVADFGRPRRTSRLRS